MLYEEPEERGLVGLFNLYFGSDGYMVSFSRHNPQIA